MEGKREASVAVMAVFMQGFLLQHKNGTNYVDR